jgi:hypothetical protein
MEQHLVGYHGGKLRKDYMPQVFLERSVARSGKLFTGTRAKYFYYSGGCCYLNIKVYRSGSLFNL